jgi:hypothetical protein
MVSGSAQRNALNKTVLGAMALTKWSDRLLAEMEKQGVERYPKQTPRVKSGRLDFLRPKYTTDDKETVTFERRQIRQLLDEMDALKRQLLRFERPTVPR